MAPVSTFHDHRATPAALVAARRCFSCQTGIHVSSAGIGWSPPSYRYGRRGPVSAAMAAPDRSRSRGYFLDRRHDRLRRRLVDHVAGSANAQKRALADVLMQPPGLRIDVDQAVLIACNDDDGHLQIGIFPPET